MTLLLVLAVAAGGIVGAPARYLVDRAVSDRVDSPFPAGTFVVNVTGSALFGLLTGLGLAHHLGATPLALLGTGFCGAYTTFSTFTVEAVRLVEEGELLSAATTIAAGIGVGLLGAAAGVAVGLAV